MRGVYRLLRTIIQEAYLPSSVGMTPDLTHKISDEIGIYTCSEEMASHSISSGYDTSYLQRKGQLILKASNLVNHGLGSFRPVEFRCWRPETPLTVEKTCSPPQPTEYVSDRYRCMCRSIQLLFYLF